MRVLSIVFYFIYAMILLPVGFAHPEQAREKKYRVPVKNNHYELSLKSLSLQSRSLPVVSPLIVEKEEGAYTCYSGQLHVPSEFGRLSSEFLFYQSKLRKKSPLLLVYAGITGITLLEKRIAKFYAKRGVTVVISHYLNMEGMQSFEKYNQSILQTALVSLGLVDFFRAYPGIDTGRIGLLGISYGGIRGLYHMALDQRIQAGVLIVAGTPLPEVLAYSDEKQVKELRAQHMRDLSLSSSREYLEFLRTIDHLPLREHLKKRSSQDFYLFISENDKKVPTFTQLQLWEQLGQPLTKRYPVGHVGTPLLATLKELDSTLRFFQKSWSW